MEGLSPFETQRRSQWFADIARSKGVSWEELAHDALEKSDLHGQVLNGKRLSMAIWGMVGKPFGPNAKWAQIRFVYRAKKTGIIKVVNPVRKKGEGKLYMVDLSGVDDGLRDGTDR